MFLFIIFFMPVVYVMRTDVIIEFSPTAMYRIKVYNNIIINAIKVACGPEPQFYIFISLEHP